MSESNGKEVKMQSTQGHGFHLD